jgi:hypothetical protein
MAVDFDTKLTGLAAEIFRDAVQVYDVYESARLLLAAPGTGMFGGLQATGSFPAITGSFPVLPGSFPAVTALGSTSVIGATGDFKGVTGSFRAITEAFWAIGQELAEPTVTLKRAFKLPGTLPGVRLLPEAELAAMARSAPTMACLDGLAQWLGTNGRLVTDTDRLTKTDAAEGAQQLGIPLERLSFLWEYALTSAWFELRDSSDRRATWAVTGQTAWRWADGDDRGALHVWAAVFAAVAATTLDVMVDTDEAGARMLDFRGQGAALPVVLFLARRSGMTVGDVEDLVRDSAIGDRPATRLKRAWDAWVRHHGHPAHRLLGELAELHAVSVPPSANGTVELTPLALWALREQFALDNISVRVLPPPSHRMSAAELVSLSDAVGDAEFDAAVATWTRSRDPGLAAAELLIYAGSSDPRGRLMAVDIARRIGVPGHRAWRDAMQRPELRGYARITLSMMGGDLLESTLPFVLEPDPDDRAWMAIDLLATAADADEPDPEKVAAQFTEAVPAGEEARIFGLMARSSHPDVARVLGVVSVYHPDRRVARQARKAARAIAKNRRLAARGRHFPPVKQGA